jgi:phosphatidylglycerol:prolipoprotein diacylglycerol transferase
VWNEVFYIGVDPVIFRIGPIAIGWYGLMVALAVITVVGWVAWQANKTKTIKMDTILTGALVGIPSGIIFSKILHLVDKWRYYLDNPGKILSGEGLTIWGAVLGAAIGVWAYSKISKGFRFTLLGDLIAPGIILAQAIGRIGCTFNGCCYGLESNSCLAVIYTNPHTYAPVGIPVLPTQIFEIFFDLALFGLLFFLKGKIKPEGSLFMVYFAFYGAWRFGIEFIRDGTPFIFGMHQAQFIGLVVMLITIPQIIWKTRWIKKETLKVEEPEVS